MTAQHSSSLPPVPVTLGGVPWPLQFRFRGWWELSRVYGDMDGVLDAAADLDGEAAAVFLWAGLLWNNPGLTHEAANMIIGEADWAELDALPGAVVVALTASQPERDEDSDGGDGDPWDWNVARAVWSAEWKQPPEAFWSLTFAEFAAFSDGLAKLYRMSKDSSVDSEGTWEGTLDELLNLGRR